jgi:hypothetical protein
VTAVVGSANAVIVLPVNPAAVAAFPINARQAIACLAVAPLQEPIVAPSATDAVASWIAANVWHQKRAEVPEYPTNVARAAAFR